MPKIKKPKLRHFDDVEQVTDYVAREIVATLEDDLMATSPYDREERREMKDRIADVQKVTTLIVSAPMLLDTMRAIDDALNVHEHHDLDGAIAKARTLASKAIAEAMEHNA